MDPATATFSPILPGGAGHSVTQRAVEEPALAAIARLWAWALATSSLSGRRADWPDLGPQRVQPGEDPGLLGRHARREPEQQQPSEDEADELSGHGAATARCAA